MNEQREPDVYQVRSGDGYPGRVVGTFTTREAAEVWIASLMIEPVFWPSAERQERREADEIVKRVKALADGC